MNYLSLVSVLLEVIDQDETGISAVLGARLNWVFFPVGIPPCNIAAPTTFTFSAVSIGTAGGAGLRGDFSGFPFPVFAERL